MFERQASIMVFTAGVAMLGSFGCGQDARKPLSVSRSALTPGWTPHLLDSSTQAWFTAAAGVSTDANSAVSSWTDQLHGVVLQQNAPGRPQYNPNGWGTGVPTITFGGGQLLQTATAWSGVPTGTEPAYTILAVLRSAAPQSASVAAWWDPNGQGYAWAGVKQAGNLTFLDSWRVYSNAPGQALAGTQDIGTTAHVVAWRYDSGTGVITEVIDGVSTASSGMPGIGPLPAMPLIVGARSLLPTGLFRGDISELRIVGRALGDDEIQNYMEYSRSQWHITTAAPNANPCLDANNNPTPPATTRCDDGNPQTYDDHCAQGSCVGGVPPSGSPAGLSPVAWYHANPQEVVVSENGISTWFDRTQNHRDLMQPFYYGRPTLGSTWAGGRPTVHFSGGQGLRRDGWSGSPVGTSQPFTILAVFQSGLPGQSSSIASWWSDSSYSYARAALRASNGDSIPSVGRGDESGTTQTLTDAVPLGATPHAVIWQYTPDTLTVTVDGQSLTSSALAPLGSVLASTFLVGMQTYLPTGLFTGDLAELAVVPRSISQAELDAFQRYVGVEWGGALCPCHDHGQCVDGGGSLACVCDPDWGGSNCSFPAGSLAGQAVYQGAPVAGAVVTLQALSGAPPVDLTAVTDQQGNFEISGVPAGFNYQVTARLSGSTPLLAAEVATAHQGQVNDVSIRLLDDQCNSTDRSLANQVACCKWALEIAQMPPAGSCTGYGTIITDPNEDSLNDGITTRLGYFKVNDEVDAVFHCPGVNEAANTLSSQGTRTIEMSIHNRRTGATCFIAQANSAPDTVAFPSLEDVNSPDPEVRNKVNAFWQFNIQRDSDDRECVECHAFGSPYIIERSAEAMQTFGLLNNGHDTTGRRLHAVDVDPTRAASLNQTMTAMGERASGTCRNCHDWFFHGGLITDSTITTLSMDGTMPPLQNDSPYRWMNHLPPLSDGEMELRSDVLFGYPGLFCGCMNPDRIEAHIVGSQNVFASDDLPDTLSTFNLREGLVCLNSQQPSNHCHDYSVNYLCESSDPVTGAPTGTFWTGWLNQSTPDGTDGDHEPRPDPTSLCASSTPAKPIAMQARTTQTNADGTTTVRTGFAPNDRLEIFSPVWGLVCRNAEQPAGQTCSNYVVRFTCSQGILNCPAPPTE